MFVDIHVLCVEIRGHLWESGFSFQLVSPPDQSLVVRRSKYLSQLSHLAGPFPVSNHPRILLDLELLEKGFLGRGQQRLFQSHVCIR